MVLYIEFLLLIKVFSHSFRIHLITASCITSVDVLSLL